MEKTAVLALGIAVAGFIATPSRAAAYRNDDLQVIKKAVREKPGARPGQEAKWFKIVIVDNAAGKAVVKLAVPLSLVEIVLHCSDNKHLRIDREKCDIDIETVVKELKAAGPMSVVELNEDNCTVRVWLE